MRHRQFLLVCLGVWACASMSNAQLMAQRFPQPKIVRYPTESAAAKYHVTIMGEVLRPGVYEFDDPNLVLPQVIEQAGGLNEERTSRNIYSFRNGHAGPQTFYSPDSRFAVMPGDILMAGRRPDLARAFPGNGSPQGAMEEDRPQIALLGLLDRPVLISLSQNSASLPGLVALLNQDRNPACKMTVFSPTSAPFAFTAENKQPIPISNGTIIAFDAQTVLRDSLPELPGIANFSEEQPPVPQQSAVQRITPKIIRMPLDQTPPQGNMISRQANPIQHASSTLEVTGQQPGMISSPTFSRGDARVNTPVERSEVVTTSQSPLSSTATIAAEPKMQHETVSRQTISESPETVDESGLHFPEATLSQKREVAINHLPANAALRDEPVREVVESRSPAGGASVIEEKEGRTATARQSAVSPAVSVSRETPVWLITVMGGIGIFCAIGLFSIMKDLNQFKKIVHETRHSQTLLDRIVRGEIPLREETVEVSAGQHYAVRPPTPARHYREDAAHIGETGGRLIPEPHVSFGRRDSREDENEFVGMRVDRAEEVISRSRSGARVGMSGTEPETRSSRPSSSTVLDRILTAVNGERHARRS